MRNPRETIGGFATGTLTRTEREALMLAALEDDALFAELAGDEDLRVALEHEEFRRDLIRRLEEKGPYRRPLWQSLAPRFHNRWLMWAPVAVALIAVVLIRQGALDQSSPAARIALGPGTIPALRMAGILETPGEGERRIEAGSRTEPPRAARGAFIALDRSGETPVYRTGDRMRLGFTVPAPAQALLIEERADGTVYRLYPNRYQSSALVNGSVTIPPPGQGDLEVEGAPGERTLRLLLFPPDVDPLGAAVEWNTVKDRVREVRRRYSVRTN